MKKSLRILTLILLSAILLPMIIACSDTTTPIETTPEQTTEVPIVNGIDLKANPYLVVRSYKAGAIEEAASITLFRAFQNNNADWAGHISDDFILGQDRDATVTNDDYEILVGNTNRAEGRAIYDTIAEDSFKICVSGKKLIIAGSNPKSTSAAVNYYIDNYISKGIYTFASDFSDTKTLAEIYADSLRYFTWNLGGLCGEASADLTVLERYMGDIIGLQECNASVHVNVLNVFIKNHPTYAHVQRYHSSGTNNHTPIIYNTAKLKLIEGGVEWLDGRYTGTSTKSLTWAVFENMSGSRFIVVNFHGAFCSNAYKGYENMSEAELTAVAKAWRDDNIRQIFDKRTELFAKYGELPFLFNGDCNFNYSSDTYTKVINGGMFDSEKTALNPIITGYKTSGKTVTSGKSIDHIFGDSKVIFNEFSIILDSECPIGSDHFPVYTDFLLRAQ